MGIPTAFNMKADTRDAIVRVLASKWPLSAKEVYLEVKQEHGLNITYQGVHKVLTQLVGEKTAVSQDRLYLLNVEWIRSLKKFTETAEKNYLKNKTTVDFLRSARSCARRTQPQRNRKDKEKWI